MKFEQVKKYIDGEIKLLKDKLKHLQNEYEKANNKRNETIYWKSEIDHQIRVLQWAIKILEKK